MPKGAKPGENRFEKVQKAKQAFRSVRINDEVIPRIKALIGHARITGETPYCRLCATFYNENLPINEKPIGYRTFQQNSDYWSLVGPLYYKYWDTSEQSQNLQQKMVGQLAVKEANRLKSELDQVRKENMTLRATLRAHGSSDTPTPQLSAANTSETESEFIEKFDKTCRALNLVLKAAGTIVLDEKAIKITCMHDDLEPEEGLVSASLVKPYLNWLHDKQAKTGGIL